MSNQKISQLTSATTPLAGTEVLPIVQSGSTKQVSVANLTANRTVAGGAYTIGSNQHLLYDIDANTIGIRIGTSGPYYNIKTTGSDSFQLNSASGGNLLLAISGTTYLQISNTTGNVTFNTGNLVQGTAAKGVNFTANTAAAGMTSQLLNWYEEGTWTPAGNGITFSTAVGRYVRIGRKVDAFFAITFPTTSNGNDAYFTGLPFTVGTDASTNVCRGGVAFGFQNSTLTGLTILGSDGQTSANFRCSSGGSGSSATQPTNAQLSAVALIGVFSYLV